MQASAGWGNLNVGWRQFGKDGGGYFVGFAVRQALVDVYAYYTRFGCKYEADAGK